MAKVRWNNYQTNEFVQSTDVLPDRSSVYIADQEQSDKEKIELVSVACIGGNQENSFGELLRDWGLYMKYRVRVYESIADYQKDFEHIMPKFLLIDSNAIDWNGKDVLEQIKLLQSYLDAGINLIFGNLPDVSVIKKYKQLRELLGIASVQQESVTTQGIHLYEGLLLGGEVIYQAEKKEDEKKQDMELTFPWYQLANATKVYMKGIMDDESVDIQEQPALIWRKSTGSSYLFAINGAYLSGATGLGILTGMLCQMQAYTIYPVINAQNFVLTGYPAMAEENSDTLQTLYSQTMSGVFRDVIWPSVSVINQKTSLGISSMIAMQYDYTDEVWPKTEELSYYMESMKEIQGEMGYSGYSVSKTDIGEKLLQDESFWEQALSTYHFSSLYRGELSDEELNRVLKTTFLSDIRTVFEPVKNTSDLIGYANEHVTRQQALIDGYEHTYSQDLLIRSVETALGYTSILTDIARVAYPQSESDAWENLSKELMANTTTYWKAFSSFDGTTLSQSDARIRNFFAMSYFSEEKENQITVTIQKNSEPVWFVLKTRDTKKVTMVEGGSYTQIEKGAWLIEADENQIEIDLDETNEQFFHQ